MQVRLPSCSSCCANGITCFHMLPKKRSRSLAAMLSFQDCCAFVHVYSNKNIFPSCCGCDEDNSTSSKHLNFQHVPTLLNPLDTRSHAKQTLGLHGRLQCFIQLTSHLCRPPLCLQQIGVQGRFHLVVRLRFIMVFRVACGSGGRMTSSRTITW